MLWWACNVCLRAHIQTADGQGESFRIQHAFCRKGNVFMSSRSRRLVLVVFSCRFYDSLQHLLIHCRSFNIPCHNAAAEDTFSGAVVERHQKVSWQINFLQTSREMQSKFLFFFKRPWMFSGAWNQILPPPPLRLCSLAGGRSDLCWNLKSALWSFLMLRTKLF